MDFLKKSERSGLMRRVRRVNTSPELIVRKLVHRLGYRFSVHKKGLPGTPDLVFVSCKKAIFVHGCFWHRHRCKRATMPKSNRKFWKSKFDVNIARDRRQRRDLRASGWSVMIVWECQTGDLQLLNSRLKKFLKP